MEPQNGNISWINSNKSSLTHELGNWQSYGLIQVLLTLGLNH